MSAWFDQLAGIIRSFDQWWIDALDILVVAFIIYQLLQFIRGTHAVQVALGGAVFIALYWTARWLNLQTVTWLVRTTLPYAVFGAIVIFQAEIRKVLAHVGKTPLFGLFSQHRTEEVIDEVVLAATTLATKKIGAIIVIEREMGLRSYIETGIALDALLTYDLLVNIFTPETPLHDGAVVLQGDRVAAAGCFLPLTVSPELSRAFGSRHRAAIGLSEDTDALAVVVSEETGTISLVISGHLQRGLDGHALKKALRGALETSADSEKNEFLAEGPRGASRKA
ncbi:MAG: diadenylate cyclase CdaA [Vicinamibacteria bacterium]|nr:diadenylate cyclase CdaA [Vicinamibacteria bacterium]